MKIICFLKVENFLKGVKNLISEVKVSLSLYCFNRFVQFLHFCFSLYWLFFLSKGNYIFVVDNLCVSCV